MFSYGYCDIFKNTYFEEHLQTAASVLNSFYSHNYLNPRALVHFRVNEVCTWTPKYDYRSQCKHIPNITSHKKK